MLKRSYMTDWVIRCLIFCIGAAQAVHMLCLFGGIALGTCGRFYMVLLGLCLGLTVCLALLEKKFRKPLEERELPDGGRPVALLLAFGVTVGLQLLFILLGSNHYLEGDMMVETVASFLQTDGIYRVNPMTGMEYTAGVPMRIKILSLPTLYAMLCRNIGCSPTLFVWWLVPVAVCILCYCAFGSLSRALFPDRPAGRAFFLLVVALVLWTGSYRFGMDGFGLLFCGWRAVTIRNLILIPYTLSLCLRRRFAEVVLCILAEACICWTLYGMGMCLAMLVLYLGVDVVGRRMERRRLQ